MSQLVRISVLIKELKKIQRLFRQEYRNAVAEKDRNETQQFLYDNYYIIDNTVKMLLSQDRKISVGINTPTETELGKLVYDAYPDSEKICEVIENAAKHREIKNSECNLIEWCFMYNVIFLIRENDEPSKLTAMLNSCRFLSGESIAEKINPIGIILSADTVYEESDCRTRRIYRDMTAHIAFKLGLSEKSVADKFISEAEKAKKNQIIKSIK